MIIKIEELAADTTTISSATSSAASTLTTSSEHHTFAANFEVLDIQQAEDISRVMASIQFRQQLVIMGATHIELFKGLGKLPEYARIILLNDLTQALAIPQRGLALSA